MKRRRAREFETIGLSFLDAICCGFGAILLLFVIARGVEPKVIERDAETIRAEIRVLQEERNELEARRKALQVELATRQAELSKAEQIGRAHV